MPAPTCTRRRHTADRMLKREHKEIIDKTPEFPAPFIVVVQGPRAERERYRVRGGRAGSSKSLCASGAGV